MPLLRISHFLLVNIFVYSTPGLCRGLDLASQALRAYDTNGDGSLQPEEWKSLRNVWGDADLDEDGVLTREELNRKLSPHLQHRDPRQEDESETEPKPAQRSYPVYRGIRSVRERLSEYDLSDEFFQLDSNQDGQIQMNEFVDFDSRDGRLIRRRLERFDGLDQINRNRIISPEEWQRGHQARR